MRLQRCLFLCSLVATSGCTNSDVYALMGTDVLTPDRLTISGELCTEDTSGSAFPVKVLLLVDTSSSMFRADPNGDRFTAPRSGLQSLIGRHRDQPHMRFGFVSVADIAKAVPPPDGQHFFRARDTQVDLAIAALQVPQGARRDITNALSQIESFITTDMSIASPGEVLRSRYLVYMLLAGPPDPATPLATLASQVDHLRSFVQEQGALEVRLDIGYLYYGPRTIDQGTDNYECFPAGTASDGPCPCDDAVNGSPQYCAVYCDVDAGTATEADNDRAREIYSNLAFIGGGQYFEYPCATSVGFDVNVTAANVRLAKKEIVAYNRNVRLGIDGPVLDSDGDGLTDDEELATIPPTLMTAWDSDNDGLGDSLEYRAAPEQNPLDASDRPASCADPATALALPDRDLDLLNDCEEGILQTSPSIADTDGDGLPDVLEFLGGTVPTSAADRLMDFDGDGVANGEEIRNHTNPRAFDGALADEFGYRNHVNSLGRQNVAVMEDPEALTAVTFRTASPNVSGGQAYLRYDACAQTLEWSDARWQWAPPFTPVPVPIDGSGPYTLTAEQRLASGEVLDRIWIEVFVTEELLPSCEQTPEVVATPLIVVSERTCYEVRISNIKLLQTAAAHGPGSEGINDVLVFFTQAPEDRLSSPGVAKVAQVRVRFLCNDPEDLSTCAREPSGEVILTDSDFVSVVP